ncbi:hypothetical protein ABCR94_15500 [Streptomyces sp. 21So2-11]|uniref:hypothetical protein n=1 Tax=Streptomyces sp. 21So2-11 TaxID=3144408 RepID=UPI0032197DC6
MRRFPHTGPPDRGRLLLTALAAGAALVGLTACASETGARDDGVAPRLSPPVSASPLWPDYAPPVPPNAGGPTPPTPQYPVLEGVTVPTGGLRKVPVKELLEKDPSVPRLVRDALTDCPGTDCGLRRPVYRDVTGDGHDEVVVAWDETSAGLTLIHVYRASGSTVRPVLTSLGSLGLTGETLGHDLVITSTADNGRFTVRYRWNGTVLAAVTPQGGAGTPSGAVSTPSPAVTTTPHTGPQPSPQSRTPQ